MISVVVLMVDDVNNVEGIDSVNVHIVSKVNDSQIKT